MERHWKDMSRRHSDWMNLTLDCWSLGAEASAVIGLRMVKLCAGGAAAQAEASRMVSEKIEAALDLQAMALSGGLGASLESAGSRSVSHYRKRVRANRRRLTRAR